MVGDEVMAAAMLDRLLHRCHVVNIQGASYRMREYKAVHGRTEHTLGTAPVATLPAPSLAQHEVDKSGTFKLDIDSQAKPSVNPDQLQDLAAARWVGYGDNLVLLGPPGVGKTHLAIGLGRRRFSYSPILAAVTPRAVDRFVSY